MTPDQILGEIRETNLSYLMLAQSLIRQDREQALYRLGISEETATLLATQLTACTARLATAPSPASPTIVQMNLTMTRGGESMTGTAAAAIEAAT